MARSKRAPFDIPSDLAYLNCAYLSPLMDSVIEAGHRAVLRKQHPWQIRHDDFFSEVEELRGLFAALIAANRDDVAIVPSTAYGIAVAANNIDLSAGDNIVVPHAEHPSTFHRWRVLAEDCGAALRVVMPAEGQSWADAVIGRIDSRTKAVSVPHVHWSDGRIFDLARIGEAARAAGSALIIDGTQSIGALPVSVAALMPDFVTCSAYKWLLCPYGFGFLYAAPWRQSGRPIEEHYFHRADAEHHEGRLDHLYGYDVGARRFDTAERASFINVTMAIPALKQVAAWTVEGIARRIGAISDAIVDGAASLGYHAPEPERRGPHLFGLRHPGGLPAGLASALNAANVHVSIRGDAIRVSPHVYNDEEDVSRFLGALRAARP